MIEQADRIRRLIHGVPPALSAVGPVWPEQERLVAEPYYIDHVVYASEARIEISGWSRNDQGIPPAAQASRFTVNGQTPLEVAYPLPREGVQQVLWQRPNATMSGFRVAVANDGRAFNAGVMEVRCTSSFSTLHERGREKWFIPDVNPHPDLPDPDRRFRVIGNRDPAGFLMLGCTDAYRLVEAYENVSGAKWQDADAVLDWGCGCGRVARHLAPALGERFHGCDIDSDNVNWCSGHLPGHYAKSTLNPPLPYPAGSFDIIYGVSVFTHLKTNWEAQWMAELHRVLRPGGYALMTVHGRTAIDFASLPPDDYVALVRRVDDEGLVVTSQNTQLNNFIGHEEEYVNCFHSDRHIREVWGRHFAEIQHLRGYIFTHDLLVCRKSF